MPRQTDSLPGQEGSMTQPNTSKKKLAPLCVAVSTLENYPVCVVNVRRSCSGVCSLQTTVHLLKMCSCTSNSLSFVLPFCAYLAVCSQSVLYTASVSMCVYLNVSFSEGNYSMSCVECD